MMKILAKGSTIALAADAVQAPGAVGAAADSASLSCCRGKSRAHRGRLDGPKRSHSGARGQLLTPSIVQVREVLRERATRKQQQQVQQGTVTGGAGNKGVMMTTAKCVWGIGHPITAISEAAAQVG